jgi:hypothetical protein
MERHLQVTIDLELDPGPIGGHVSSYRHPGRRFQGWLELASAIEQLRTAALEDPSASEQPRRLPSNGPDPELHHG